MKPGETWAVDLAALKAVVGDMPFTLEKDKSKITGKLAKTYEKDGAPWGTIELKIVMDLSPAPKGPPVSGTMTADMTVDMPTDGSSRARTMKMTGKGKLTLVEKGTKITLDMDVKQDETVTPEK